MPWYSMTALYHWEATGNTLPKFERRTTVCSAPDEQTADAVLLEAAEEYQGDNVKLLENITQELDEPPSAEPVEIAHEMRVGVDLDSGNVITPDEFLRRYWNVSKIKSCDILGIGHSWHNRDGVTSGCYNCEEVRVGRLWETDDEAKPAEQDVDPNA